MRKEKNVVPVASMFGTCNGSDGAALPPQPIKEITFSDGTKEIGCKWLIQENGKNICFATESPCPVSPKGKPHNPFIAFNSGTQNYALDPDGGILVDNRGEITHHTQGEGAILK